MKNKQFIFLLTAILLQPVINSITGISIKTGFPSIVGPIFFTILFLYLTTLNASKGSYLSVSVVLVTILIFFIHLSQGDSSILDAASYIKVILPLIIFDYVRSICFTGGQLLKLRNAIGFSVGVYAVLVFASFGFGYQIQEGKGYYGFIYAGNDLVALFILFGSMAFWHGLGYPKTILLVVFAHALTYSKSAIVYPLLYSLGRVGKSIVAKATVFALSALGIYIFFSVYLSPLLLSFFTRSSSILDLTNENSDDVLKVLTFGRSFYLDDAIGYMQSNSFSWILGAGIRGSETALSGKIGIEMDFFDALLMYGFIGATFLVAFYYFLPLFSRNINLQSKLFLLVLVLYSFFGGHVYNNPLVGFYYGIFIGLVYNRCHNIIDANRRYQGLLRRDAKFSPST